MPGPTSSGPSAPPARPAPPSSCASGEHGRDERPPRGDRPARLARRPRHPRPRRRRLAQLEGPRRPAQHQPADAPALQPRAEPGRERLAARAEPGRERLAVPSPEPPCEPRPSPEPPREPRPPQLRRHRRGLPRRLERAPRRPGTRSDRRLRASFADRRARTRRAALGITRPTSAWRWGLVRACCRFSGRSRAHASRFITW